MSQNEQVCCLLQTGPLTQAQANNLGIGRLAARVKDLRNQGVSIHSENVAVYKANGKLAHVAVYSMGQ